jgi:hypothetical protein
VLGVLLIDTFWVCADVVPAAYVNVSMLGFAVSVCPVVWPTTSWIGMLAVGKLLMF